MFTGVIHHDHRVWSLLELGCQTNMGTITGQHRRVVLAERVHLKSVVNFEGAHPGKEVVNECLWGDEGAGVPGCGLVPPGHLFAECSEGDV